MTHSKQTARLIRWLIHESGVTAYRINKDTGISANAINRITKDGSPIENLSLATAMKLEEYAIKLKEEINMEKNLKVIIEGVENGKIGLVNDWEFHEEDYTDGATDVYIVQRVDGHEDVELYFAEKDFIQEMREAVYREDRIEDDLNDLLEGLNELNDQFDYDKVVAYRVDNNPIEWVQ